MALLPVSDRHERVAVTVLRDLIAGVIAFVVWLAIALAAVGK